LGEHGIDPFAKPGFLRSLAEDFGDQQIINPAPLDGHTLLFI
jgi:hypothetical protein